MNDIAAAKIKMLKGSTQCLVFGMLGLLPVIGLPFAVAALWISGQVRGAEKRFWNAGKSYRIIGTGCAAFGMVFWFFLISLIIYNVVFNSGGGGGYYGGSGDE